MATQRRDERGATWVETAIAGSVVTLLVAVAVVYGVREYAGMVGEGHHAAVVDGHAYSHSAEAVAPVAVNVVAAATVADPAIPEGGDACGALPGVQPQAFDCSLPLFVDALHTVSEVTAGYVCADSANYHVFGGQSESAHKKCVLKTADRS